MDRTLPFYSKICGSIASFMLFIRVGSMDNSKRTAETEDLLLLADHIFFFFVEKLPSEKKKFSYS